jgi:hypothetical protein
MVRVPRFFHDMFIRQALQGIYAGIVGSERNAEMLCRLENPSTVSHEQVCGNEIARHGFLTGVRWLNTISEFVVSDSVFTSQILTPLKLSSMYLLEVRGEKKKTTTLRGLVYAVSRPFFSRYFEQMVVDLSLVIPQLGAAMLYRCPLSIAPEDCLFKEYDIPDAQPIPFINRIHPSRFPDRLPSVNSSKIMLDGYAFLNTSLRDLKTASRSFALENYCEAESTIYGGRRLGIPCILSGKVMGIDGRTVILGGIFKNGGSCNLRLTPACIENTGEDGEMRKEKLIGKPVKALTIIWYRYSRGRPETPEALYIQECDDDLEASLNDATGYVRLRGRVGVDRIREVYGLRVAELLSGHVVFDGQSLVWMDRLPDRDDTVVSSFVEALGGLRGIRAAAGHVLLPLNSILDRKKLLAEHYAQVLRRRNLLPVLLSLVHACEKHDCLAESFKELERKIPELGDRYYYARELEEAVYYLRGMGLTRRVRKPHGWCVELSQHSFEVAYAAERDRVDSILRLMLERQGWLSVFDLLRVQEYPLSVLLQGIRNLERTGVVAPLYFLESGVCIVWRAVKNQPDMNHILRELSLHKSRIMDSILSVLTGIPHSISTEKLAEELGSRGIRITKELLALLLRSLKRQGRIQQVDNNMWFYPWERRVIDFLEGRQSQVFTEEEIVKAINMPYPERIAFRRQYLEKLESQGIIERLGEYFCLRSSDLDVRRQQYESFVRREIEGRVLQMLKEFRRIDEQTLKARLRIMLTTLTHERGYRGLEANRVVDSIWRCLMNSGKIQVSGGYIIYRGGSEKNGDGTRDSRTHRA